jgi:hypothetical protein
MKPLIKNTFLGGASHMIKSWNLHEEYIDFLFNTSSTLNASELKRLDSYSNLIKKLTSLNFDLLHSALELFFSKTGRLALDQPEIFIL